LITLSSPLFFEVYALLDQLNVAALLLLLPFLLQYLTLIASGQGTFVWSKAVNNLNKSFRCQIYGGIFSRALHVLRLEFFGLWRKSAVAWQIYI
jgi:hypothetical protein